MMQALSRPDRPDGRLARWLEICANEPKAAILTADSSNPACGYEQNARTKPKMRKICRLHRLNGFVVC
jgi:hypothetical protein